MECTFPTPRAAYVPWWQSAQQVSLTRSMEKNLHHAPQTNCSQGNVMARVSEARYTLEMALVAEP